MTWTPTTHPEHWDARDEVYEKCIRKAEQQLRSYVPGPAERALKALILSLKSMRHSEHEDRK